MFRSPKITLARVLGEYDRKIHGEAVDCLEGIDDILKLSESADYQAELLKLKEKTVAYDVGLENIITSNNDASVFYAQGQLLELIAAYHNIINQANIKLNTKG